MNKLIRTSFIFILSANTFAATEIEKLNVCLKATSWQIGSNRLDMDPDVLGDHSWALEPGYKNYLIHPNGNTYKCRLYLNNVYFDSSECENNSSGTVGGRRYVSMKDPDTGASLGMGFNDEEISCDQAYAKPIPGTVCSMLYNDTVKQAFFRKIRANISSQLSLLEKSLKSRVSGSYSVENMIKDAGILLDRCSGFEGFDLSVEKQRFTDANVIKDPMRARKSSSSVTPE